MGKLELPRIIPNERVVKDSVGDGQELRHVGVQVAGPPNAVLITYPILA
jgi:hypothetical protein